MYGQYTEKINKMYKDIKSGKINRSDIEKQLVEWKFSSKACRHIMLIIDLHLTGMVQSSQNTIPCDEDCFHCMYDDCIVNEKLLPIDPYIYIAELEK